MFTVHICCEISENLQRQNVGNLHANCHSNGILTAPIPFTLSSQRSGFNAPKHLKISCFSVSYILAFEHSAFLSFAITLLCVVCYCFNKIINKNSMAFYRRHLMEAANNQNVDIYTVEQVKETLRICECYLWSDILIKRQFVLKRLK